MLQKQISLELLAQITEAQELCQNKQPLKARLIFEELAIENLKNYHFLTSYGTFELIEGNIAKGIDLIKRSISLEKNQPQALVNLLMIYRDNQQLDECLSVSNILVEVESKNPINYLNRGQILMSLGSYNDALKDFDFTLKLTPNFFEAYINQSSCYRALKKFNNALDSCNSAIKLKPDHSEGYYNKAVILNDMNDLEGAKLNLEYCLDINSKHVNALIGLGLNYQLKKEFESASRYYDKAIKIDPNNALALFNQSLIELGNGNYKNGWKLYEFRWQSILKNSCRTFEVPVWSGKESLKNKNIFIYAEQGLGDTIQFCRYLKLIEESEANIFFECPKELVAIIKSSKIDCEFIEQNSILSKISFDFNSPLLSLPLAFNTESDSIPYSTSYLKASADKKKYWDDKLGSRNKLRVGLVWAGGARPDKLESISVNKRRNISLELLSPLINIEEIEFYSLQKGEIAETELRALKNDKWSDKNIIDYSSELNDFSDTAGLIENLDLVISVDTSTAHLSAALGKPTWILNRFDGCWRWLNDNRTGSPWYKAVRLFRQSEPYNWKDVINEVYNELENLKNSNT